MALFNEDYQQLTDDDIADAKAALQELDNVPVLSTEDMEAQLNDYYTDARTFREQTNPANGPSPELVTFISWGGILDAFREAICKVLPPQATIDQIVDAVLDAIGNLFWGFFRLAIVRRLVKYLVDMSIGAFCPNPATP